MIDDIIFDNSIIITSYSNKINILKDLNKSNKLYNIKFFTMEEFKEKLLFSYDEKSIYYLMDKYNLKYDIACIYLKNMRYIENKEYQDIKLLELKKLKDEMFSNNFLYKDNYFKEYISNKNIIFYGFDSFSKDEDLLINSLKDIALVKVITKEYKEYHHDIYHFNGIYDEIEFVACEISKLIHSGVPISKIKLTNIDNDYVDIINDIFKMFNFNIINPGMMISTLICSSFLELDGDIPSRIEFLSKKYSGNDVFDKLINVVNKYICFDNYSIVNEMIRCELKNMPIPCKNKSNTIEVINFLDTYVDDDTYVFMLNFNQNSIPKLFKDEDYITDSMKSEIIMDYTISKNKRMRESVIKNIYNIKNLIITYKDSTPFKTYFPSDLINDLGFSVLDGVISLDESYSEIYSRIKLAKMLDNYVKTGVIFPDTSYLYSNYKDILFSTYNNKYSRINNDLLLTYLENHINLAYSSMDNYFKCPFRYYLCNVLKLDIYEEKFETYLGSLFHYVLENSFKNRDSVSYLIDEFIKNNDRVLSKKEMFFVNKIEKDIEFVLLVINEQLNNSDLKDMLFENKITVNKSYGDISITFKGFIDKIMYKEDNGRCICAIIDYKTGFTDIKLGYVPFGLYMQLPVYLYLAKHSDKLVNVTFAGFYLQRVLNSLVSVSGKKSCDTLKREGLLLNGYSNFDQDILHMFDNTYKDSRFIKSMRLKKDETFMNYCNVLSNEQIDNLINLVDNKIDDAIEGICNSKFDILPRRVDNDYIGCNFCKFRDICFRENEDYDLIIPYKDLDFLGGSEYE